MGNRRHHKERIKELEELRSRIEDTGTGITVDEAELVRAVHDGQLAENSFWVRLPEEQTLPEYENGPEIGDIRENVDLFKDAGQLPTTKPLLYFADFLQMNRARMKEQLENEDDPARKQIITVELHKIDGKIEMCADWLRVQVEHGNWGALVLGKDGYEPKMPTLGSKTEVEEHIRSRHLGMAGIDEEEMKEGRISRYKQDADIHAQAVSDANEQEKD